MQHKVLLVVPLTPSPMAALPAMYSLLSFLQDNRPGSPASPPQVIHQVRQPYVTIVTIPTWSIELGIEPWCQGLLWGVSPSKASPASAWWPSNLAYPLLALGLSLDINPYLWDARVTISAICCPHCIFQFLCLSSTLIISSLNYSILLLLLLLMPPIIVIIASIWVLIMC